MPGCYTVTEVIYLRQDGSSHRTTLASTRIEATDNQAEKCRMNSGETATELLGVAVTVYIASR